MEMMTKFKAKNFFEHDMKKYLELLTGGDVI